MRIKLNKEKAEEVSETKWFRATAEVEIDDKKIEVEYSFCGYWDDNLGFLGSEFGEILDFSEEIPEQLEDEIDKALKKEFEDKKKFESVYK